MKPEFFLFVFLSLHGVLPLTATDFSVHLPENLFWVIESRNIPEQREIWQQTPFYQSLQEVNWNVLTRGIAAQDPEFNEAEFNRSFDEIRSTWKALEEQFNGSAVFAVGDLSNLVDLLREFEESMEFDLDQMTREPESGENLEEEEPMTEQDIKVMQSVLGAFYLMADVEDADAVRETLTNATDRLLQLSEEKDLTPYSRDGVEGLEMLDHENPIGGGFFWSVEENILVIGFTPEAVKTQREWIRSPPVDSLSSNEEYLHTRERMMEDYHILSFFPVGKLISRLRTLVLEEAEPEDRITVERVFEWLNPGAMLPLSFSFKSRMNGWEARSLAGFKEECGLQRLFLGPQGESSPRPSFTHKNFASVSTVSWSLNRFYEALEAELQKMAPEAAAGLGFGRMMAAGQLGFDFKLQLLDHLGDGIVAFQTVDENAITEVLEAEFHGDVDEQTRAMEKHPTEGQYHLIGIELKNQEAIQQTLNTVLAKMEIQKLPETDSYRGVDIIRPLAGMPGADAAEDLVSYAFLEKYLLVSIGKVNLLHMAIDAHTDPELQFWNQEEYHLLRNQFQFDTISEDYTSDEMLKAIFHAVKLGFVTGFTEQLEPEQRQAVAGELKKIRFGSGRILGVNEADDLEIRGTTLYVY